MKKMTMVLAAVAMAMTSIAETSVQIYAEMGAYSTIDKQPGASHASWYSMYSMTTAQAQELMGASSFVYYDFNEWIQKVGIGRYDHQDVEVNIVTLIKQNSEYLACSGFSNGRYVFDNGKSGTFDDATDVVSVWFFDTGSAGGQAYYTAYITDFDNYYYGDMENDGYADNWSGWQPISTSGGGGDIIDAPEPTSGLLLLVGLAGLALKRKRA